MVGLSVAWFLQGLGTEVTVVDRDGVAAGSSWGNAGYLTPALTLPLPEPSVLKYGLRSLVSTNSPVGIRPDPRLAEFLPAFALHSTTRRWRESMQIFNQLNRASLDAYDELTGNGVAATTNPAEPFLATATTAERRNGLVDELEQAMSTGAAIDYDLIEGDQVRQVEPCLTDVPHYGVRIGGQRFINPPQFVGALADAVRSRGGTIVDGFDVVDIADLGTAVELRPRGSGQPLRSDRVVIANGARLNQLAYKFGVHRMVQAGRGYSFTVYPQDRPTHPLYFPAERVACTPFDGGLRVTGIMDFESPDAAFNPRRIDAIVSSIAPMFTCVDWSNRTNEWVGSRPCTADGLPLIGRTRSDRVHIAGGHGMWGVVLGPLTGRLMADMVGGRPAEVPTQLDPLR
jgi:D-amino-acid dehydrogenase